jgi:RNA polymerase II subunit A C-terminal domain phosphatase
MIHHAFQCTWLTLSQKSTAKVKDAIRRYPRCKIVHLNWLLMTASSWRRLDETDYFLDEPRSDALSPPNGLENLEAQALLSSDEEDDGEGLSLPSAGIANVRGETPESEEEAPEDVDIGELDWGDADKEVNDFLAEMGEDAVYTTDESDNERFVNAEDVRLIE